MTAIEDLMRAALLVDEARKAGALRVLRGEAEAVDPAEALRQRRSVSGPLLMSMGAAAAFLGVSRGTLWRMIDAGRLEKVELFHNSNRIRREDLEAIVEKRGIDETLEAETGERDFSTTEGMDLGKGGIKKDSG